MNDRIDKKEIRVEYCPTSIMLADIFTKPLQGTLFQQFRDILIGYKSITILGQKSSKIKEHFRNTDENRENIVS